MDDSARRGAWPPKAGGVGGGEGAWPRAGMGRRSKGRRAAASIGDWRGWALGAVLAAVLSAGGAAGGSGGGGGGEPARVRLHLAPRDVDALHAHARAVQAGERALGGASRWEILEELSRPREGALARVSAWASALGGRVASTSPMGDFLEVHLPREAADLLGSPGTDLSEDLPAAISRDVLSARRVGAPPVSRAKAQIQPPGAGSTRAARRSLLQTDGGDDGGDDGDDGDDGGDDGSMYFDDGEPSDDGNSSDASASIAATMLFGLNYQVYQAYTAWLGPQKILNDLDLQRAPAIIIPCEVSVDPLTDALAVKYHGTAGVECDFSVSASFRTWYGGDFERSTGERTVALQKPERLSCGDLFPNATAEESCRGWGAAISQGLSLAVPDRAVVPDITVDTSVFVYPLVENGLPTHVGILDGTLAVRMELEGLSEIISDYDADNGYGVLTELADSLQCSDGKEGASCMKVNSTDAYYEYDSDYVPLAGLSLRSSAMFPVFNYGASILGATITPQYAKAVYGANGTGSGLGMSALKGSLVSGNYAGNFMNQSALAEATSAFDLPTPEVVMYQGPLGPSNFYKGAAKLGYDFLEPDLDVQMIAEYSPGADVGFIPWWGNMQQPDCCEDSAETYNIAGCQDVEYYVEVLQRNQLTSPPKALPKFISLSYGVVELSLAQTYEANNEFCEESFAKLIAMGVILLGSNFDYGASGIGYWFVPGRVLGSTSVPQCNLDGVVGTSLLAPAYPATSPYVTSVSATMDVRMSEGSEPVVAACMAPMGGLITAGGGFSTIFDRPAWQEDAVSEYLAMDHSDFPYFPGSTSVGQVRALASGRGSPDVSLYGFNIPLSTSGVTASASGTSASTPMFGGLLLQLHARLEESGVCGSREITFVQLNRFLYKAAKTHPDAFIDVVHGNNAFDASTTNCGLGYPAAKGWDPVTGLGMINMPEFTKAAEELAEEYFCS